MRSYKLHLFMMLCELIIPLDAQCLFNLILSSGGAMSMPTMLSLKFYTTLILFNGSLAQETS